MNQVNSGTNHSGDVTSESPRPALEKGLVTVEQFLASERPMRLDPGFDGSCPCSFIVGESFEVETHCWRTSSDGCGCQWSGVHVNGLEHEQAMQVAIHMRDNNGWSSHTDWTVVIDGVAANAPEQDAER